MQTRSSKLQPRPSSPAQPLRADTPQHSLAAPRPSAGPSRLQRLLINPPDISDNSSIPFSALISRTTSALNAPDSESPIPSLPHTPSPDSPAQPTTPRRPAAPTWLDVTAPIPAPEFGVRDSQDSSLAAPTQTLRFPEIHNNSATPASPPGTAPTRNRQSTFQLNPAFASATTLPRPLLLPAFSATNNRPLLQQPVPVMSQSTVQRSGAGPSAMPTARSHRAPYFSGRVGDSIEEFLDEYEELASSCGLSERQKVETVVRYIPKVLKDFWRSQDGYLARDWTDLRLTLEGIYDDTSALSHHSEQKLMDFVKQSSKHRMNDEEDVLQYYRHFLVLSKPLLDSHRLTYSERDRAFWSGFHSRDRAEMYTRLIAKHPDQPSWVHFDYMDVYRVARATFSGNHLLDRDLSDSWEESQGLRSSRLERTRERWLDLEEREPRGANSSHRTQER